MSDNQPQDAKPAEVREEAAGEMTMEKARTIAILHAAIRRLPEQSWPSSGQQFTSHRYI